MAQAVKRLRAALDEYRASARPPARPLRQAMENVREALPSAFDAKNEKMSGPHEKEASDLYHECDEALKSVRTPSTVAKGKRSRSEGEVNLQDTKYALFSDVPPS